LILLSFFCFFEIDEAKIYRMAGVVDAFSIDRINFPTDGGKSPMKMQMGGWR